MRRKHLRGHQLVLLRMAFVTKNIDRRRMSRGRVKRRFNQPAVAVVAWAFACHAAFGQGPAASPNAVISLRQSEPGDRARQAEELLDGLRRRLPNSEVIPPASASEPSASRPRVLLLPEGTAVVDEIGSLRRNDEWWVAEIASKARPRLKMLPNSTLDAMVRMTRTAAGPLHFRISGELTVFEGENYLLARSAVRALSALSASEGGEQEPSISSKRGELPAEGAPVKSETPDQLDWDADADAVLERMRNLSPEMPAMSSDEPGMGEPFSRGGASRVRFLEGSTLIGRTGRLVREGTGWSLAFDSDHSDQLDATLRLLPNRGLEFMAAAARDNPIGLTFVISGEITEFDGQNHLLVRAVRRPFEGGNLRK